MSTQPELAIVIINYRTHKMTCECLESLLPEISGLDAQVLVVDNASGDDSVNVLERWIKDSGTNKIQLIASDRNGGFAAGNNIGISHISADNYLLLNSDTIVRKGAIKLLLDSIKTQQSAGLVSPRLEWLDGQPQQSCFNLHTPISEFLHAAKTGPISNLFKKYVVAKPVQDTLSYSAWTSFACVMIRGEVLAQVGLLDEGFFMYFEDAEFCHRAAKAGWQIINDPRAHVVHLRGGSSPVKTQTRLRKRLPKYYFESRSRYFYLLYGHAGLLAANLLWTAGAFISGFRRLISSSYLPDISQKQWLDIWTNFFNPLRDYTHPDDYPKA
ncbi:MAG: glycosyltransferase family 2 protein [Methylophaga sp.]|nr:glycosyltransferase family 2 protein [Methylophaga sp.]